MRRGVCVFTVRPTSKIWLCTQSPQWTRGKKEQELASKCQTGLQQSITSLKLFMCEFDAAPVSVSPGLLFTRSSLFCRAAAFFSAAKQQTLREVVYSRPIKTSACIYFQSLTTRCLPRLQSPVLLSHITLTCSGLQLLVLLFPPFPGFEDASEAGQFTVAAGGRRTNPWDKDTWVQSSLLVHHIYKTRQSTDSCCSEFWKNESYIDHLLHWNILGKLTFEAL